jgi:hypothetical protein
MNTTCKQDKNSQLLTIAGRYCNHYDLMVNKQIEQF